MKRKLLKTIQQSNVKKKKNIAEIYLELNSKFTQVQLAKKLGVSTSTLRKYKNFFFGLKSDKGDIQPPEKRIKKLKDIAKANGISTYKITEIKGIPKLVNIDTILTSITEKEISKAEKKYKDYYGFLLKVNIIYKFKHGSSVEKWYADLIPRSDRKKLDSIISLWIINLTSEIYVEYFIIKSLSISLTGERQKTKVSDIKQTKTTKRRK